MESSDTSDGKSSHRGEQAAAQPTRRRLAVNRRGCWLPRSPCPQLGRLWRDTPGGFRSSLELEVRQHRGVQALRVGESTRLAPAFRPPPSSPLTSPPHPPSPPRPLPPSFPTTSRWAPPAQTTPPPPPAQTASAA